MGENKEFFIEEGTKWRVVTDNAMGSMFSSLREHYTIIELPVKHFV